MYSEAEMAMDPQVTQELAYMLLTELLAYQFASPVRWTETQDVLLGEHNVERFVEIGPSDTLVSMAKKTIASRYRTHDSARSFNRKLLYYKKDTREIKYEVDASAQKEEPSNNSLSAAGKKVSAAEVKSNEVSVTVQAPPSAVPAAPVAELVVATKIPDVPVTAKEIIVAVVAQNLKKPFNEVESNKSVKQLVGGRSTLQNEIVGDIGTAFGSVPERAEEMEIDALASTLQSTDICGAQLAKTITNLTSRLFSLKMPGGFGISAARRYLESHWGLEHGRQDSVLIRASTVQPASRLASVQDAETYFGEIAQKYGVDGGLALSSVTASSVALPTNIVSSTTHDGSSANNSVSVTAADLNHSRVDLQDRHIKIVNRIDIEAQQAANELRKELDLLNAELGSAFVSGIHPKWSILKVRRFDSYWNWAVQDMLDLFYSIAIGKYEITDPAVHRRSVTIANRTDSRLIATTRYIIQTNWPGELDRLAMAKRVLQSLLESCERLLPSPERFVSYVDMNAIGLAPQTTIDTSGRINYQEIPRSLIKAKTTAIGRHNTAEIKSKTLLGWTRNEQLTAVYQRLLDDALCNGPSFSGKNILITGAGSASIGAEILRSLLNGGANVIVTTSSYSPNVVKYYQDIYVQDGARDSQLIVVPFNQGSQQDVEALTKYIFDSSQGLGWDLDHVVPFAALSEAGREVDGLDSKSELAHRIMLTNLLRLFGAIKKHKQSRGYDTHPTQVILPLSPNHGIFGNDGLYAESKIGLETLFNKWHSESWGPYLSLCGAVIGWTRGTGLMAGNNSVASSLEDMGVRTFSQAEMAFYTTNLMRGTLAIQSEVEPLWADFTGGLDAVPDLKRILNESRKHLHSQSDIHDALGREIANDEIVMTGLQEKLETDNKVKPTANLKLHFPQLPEYNEEIESLHHGLGGMVDLERVVVVTGFSELGPYGNSRTRWEMEAYGTFSLEGCIEIAWIMGLIKHHNGQLGGKHYTGWVDVKTKKPVHDSEVKSKYEKHILEHTGIRLVEPELDDGYDPNKKQFLQEIILEDDLAPFTVPRETAEQFKHEHGENAEIFEAEGGEEWSVLLRKGATLMVPKALKFNRTVAGQVPSGWDPKFYGIDEATISQVDRATLFALISTVEALHASGITDPYELYKYIHVSEIGNCIGSGFGGTQSFKKMFKTRYLDKPVQSDILQETFINTIPAWINMLILSASGPIRTAVGACATSIESLESGFETIVTKRARMCLVGGVDDMTEAVAYEFANMKATSNSEEESAKGRIPGDMSRPMTSTRSGFMESQGSGIQVITSARLALDMGLPIHGIIAWAGTASDKIGRSVPAPGRGILTNAREVSGNGLPPLLDLSFRRKRLELKKQQIKECLESELALMQGDLEASGAIERIDYATKYLKSEAEKQYKAALNALGNDFWVNDPHISPIRGALAVWGLTIDDLDVASFHGTSTVMNDKNETGVIQAQLDHLGRSKGNPIYGISQKYLTGHSKGAAGAWMLNGCLQVIGSGLVPGNRNADNIDIALRKNESIILPNTSIQTTGLKAFTLTSFGFGQKGAQAIGVHPRYLFACLGKDEFETYRSKLLVRQKQATSFFQRALSTNTIFVAKKQAPYSDAQEKAVLLNPEARVSSVGEDLLFDDESIKGII